MKTRTTRILLCLLIAAFVLSACQPVAPSPAVAASAGENALAAGAATAAPNDVTGPGGDSQVTVSDGVVLLTPGAPLPTPDVSDLLDELRAYAEADPQVSGQSQPEPAEGQPAQPPADPAAVELPEGISMYPGATDLELAPAGGAMMYVTFYTSDEPTAVLEAYVQQAEAAQYSNIGLELPNERGEYDGSWMKSGLILTVTATPQDDGRVMVMIAWMEM